ncbi:DUF1643 domain-containing protein [Sulfitobacter sp. D35]|uniref:DUF1643 domain-containing protein n=1 Tax=Sulfitobacter sp. D35 TaxID=3083252 RepID=UPI00296EA224|nr:DUF1643 domain-containing protein [Sulfitobacter sp. D35]MDW4498380.1 DUF1643 domain-containing protein [Sulfitobacter sp. D35]
MAEPGTVLRRHAADGVASSATYSDCGSYRYDLTRVWADGGTRVGFVMLNPSTATEAQNDPTIERCQRRAVRMGFGAFRACNLFAWRATDPADLRRAQAPVGPGNDAAILACADWADLLIVAWGVHGAHRARGAEVAARLGAAGYAMHHLGLTRKGHPRHPLYLRYDLEPQSWRPEVAATR